MKGNTGSADDKKRRHAVAVQAAMRRRAKSRQCSKCGRKSALIRIWEGPIIIGTICRWCKHEKLT